jgi:hypothetical protein
MSQPKHVFLTTTDSAGVKFKSTCERCGYTVVGNGHVIFVLDKDGTVIPDAVENKNCYSERESAYE